METKCNPEEFGKRVCLCRLAMGLSPQALAQKTNLTPEYVEKIEAGMARYVEEARAQEGLPYLLDALAAMSELFNVSTDWLLTGKEGHH